VIPTDRFPVVGVIADDLSGATMCGAILRKAGLRTVVVGHQDLWPERPEAIVVNVETRIADVGNLRAEGQPLIVQGSGYIVQQAAKRLVGDLRCQRLELRVDGGLRRRYVDELRGLVRGSGLEDPVVIAVPAHPAAGRLTREGEQVTFLSGTDTNGDPTMAAPLMAAPRLFGDMPARLIARSISRDGPEAVVEWLTAQLPYARHFLADAESDKTLRVIAEAAAKIGEHEHVITMSSGAWLQFHPVLPVRPEFVLVAIGLHTGPNARQLQRLLDGDRCKLMFPAEAMSYSLPGGGFRDIVSQVDAIVIKAHPNDDDGEPRAVDDDRARVDAANEVADAVLAILEKAHRQRFRCRGIVATGDYTAASVVKCLKARGVDPIGEVVPHCAVEGQIAAGQWMGMPMIVKSGRVGNEFALRDLVRRLRR
jgi:uncharacterized protein YgbK (DUF1537 family)